MRYNLLMVCFSYSLKMKNIQSDIMMFICIISVMVHISLHWQKMDEVLFKDCTDHEGSLFRAKKG